MTAEKTDPYVLSPEKAAGMLAGAPWRRMVTIGDSIAEGVREPVAGYRDLSWTDRIEEALGRVNPGLAARNLGRRDLVAAEIRAAQLGPALEFRPDLAIVVAGGNDMLAREFDPDAVRHELAAMVAALRTAGADVVTIGLLDITAFGLGHPKLRDAISARTRLLGALTAEVAAAYGACYVPSDATGVDPGVWGADQLHFNARGHAVYAAAVVRALAAHVAGSDHLASA